MTTIIFDARKERIQSVTVFSSNGAEITRSFKIELKQGQNEIRIVGLPECVDTDSVRLKGLDDTFAVLFDVVCTTHDTMDAENPNRTPIHVLQRKLEALKSLRRVREQESEILVDFYKRIKVDSIPSTETTNTLFDAFVRRGEENSKSVADLAEKIELLEGDIELEEEKEEKNPMSGLIKAVIMAQRDGNSEVTITYVVRAASWKPSYDLHATSKNGRPDDNLTLFYRASIKQNSGEDWKDTTLTLSTSTPDSAFRPPELVKMKIVPAPADGAPEPPQVSAQLGRGGAKRHRMILTKRYRRHSSASEASVDEVLPAAEGAIVSSSVFTSTFRIQGDCSIPSDGEAHKAVVAIIPFQAKINLVSVPKARAMAFYQCAVQNTSEYRLLAGTVSVFLDDSPVSRTSIADVSPATQFSCTLGPDPYLRITYQTYPTIFDKTTRSAFTSQFVRTIYQTAIIIQNNHDYDVKGVTLRDILPVSEDENVRVEVVKPEELGPADVGVEVKVKEGTMVRWVKQEEGEPTEEGKYEWIVDVEKGKEVKLEAEWNVRAPEEFKWVVQ